MEIKKFFAYFQAPRFIDGVILITLMFLTFDFREAVDSLPAAAVIKNVRSTEIPTFDVGEEMRHGTFKYCDAFPMGEDTHASRE